MNWGVNWQDGMKIRAENFLDERRYTASLLSQYSRFFVHDKNFGKLNTDHDTPLYLIKENTLFIRRYDGITKGGHFIQVNESNADALSGISLSDLEQKYNPDEKISILLKLNLNQTLAIGDPDSNEMPFRQPYAFFEIITDHISSAQMEANLLSDISIPVLQLIRAQNSVVVDESYIPPVACIKAHKGLLSWFYELVNLNYQIAALNSDTIQRLSSDTHTSYLKSSITILCTQMAFFMANNMDEFADEYYEFSPKKIVGFYKKMSRIINASLVAMHNRERVIQYMADWTGNTPEGFLDKIEAISQINYSPMDINLIKSELNNFTMLIKELFNKLQALNYLN